MPGIPSPNKSGPGRNVNEEILNSNQISKIGV